MTWVIDVIKRIGKFVIALTVSVFASATIANAEPTGGINPPEFSQWESKMLTFGDKLGKFLDPASSASSSERLAAQYYDAQWVFFQIADYTGNAQPWGDYGTYAEMRYRDEHLRATNYQTQGFRRFPHGIFEDWRRNGDSTITDVTGIRDFPAYSNISELSHSNGRSGFFESISREVAYSVNSNITAELAGEPRVVNNGKARLHSLVEMIENHLWEWRNQTYENPNGGRMSPFMVGLTSHALIEFYELERANGRDPNAYFPKTHWPTISAALEDVGSWMRESALIASGSNAGQRMYVANYNGSDYGVFRYEDLGSANPSPDLSQLVAPLYYWLYKETGTSKYLIYGDELWGSGVAYGFHDGGKQFNQLYRLAFLSLQWRRAGAVRPNGPTGLSVN